MIILCNYLEVCSSENLILGYNQTNYSELKLAYSFDL